MVIIKQLLRNLKYTSSALFLFVIATQALADQRTPYRGEAGSFTNDYFGDGHDRWRSGSYQRSYYSERYRIKRTDGSELRVRGEMVTPWTPSRQPGGDIAYSTLLGFGAFAHTNFLGLETRGGGEVLLIGDISGMEFIQRSFHEAFQMDTSFDPSRDDIERVEDRVALRFELETARTIRLGSRAAVRPYMELTFGADQAVTVGTDMILGNIALAEVWTRDVVTGRLLTPQVDQIPGMSLVAGWDARLNDSYVHLPDDQSVDLEEITYRSRVGLQTNIAFANVFVGQAWLSPIFVGQAEHQRVGMLSISFDF